MYSPSTDDDIIYIDVKNSNIHLKFFQTSPYINSTNNAKFARLVYTTKIPYGKESIQTKVEGKTWYKVVHKYKKGQKFSVSNQEILKKASSNNFPSGSGIHSQFSKIGNGQIVKLQKSESAEVKFGDYLNTLIEISDFYKISVSELHITGSSTAFQLNYANLNDLDVVIPVKNESHLHYLNKYTKNPSNVSRVALGSRLSRNLDKKFSSLRWIHKSDQIICPFFVYSGLVPPVTEIIATRSSIKGKVQITDDEQGIFNTQYFKCSGVIDRLMVCSTVARGEIRNGMEFFIDCPIYHVKRGKWASKDIAVVNSQYLNFGNNKLVGNWKKEF